MLITTQRCCTADRPHFLWSLPLSNACSLICATPTATCCTQSLVDVYVRKEVTPSTIQRAGSILLYRVEVGVRSNASRPADTVTMVDAMPEGMSLVAVVEEPDEGGESPFLLL